MHCGFDLLQRLERRLRACCQPGDTQRVGLRHKHRRFRNIDDVPFGHIDCRLRHNIEKQLDMFSMHCVLVANHLPAVSVPQSVVASIDSGEDFAHEQPARRHGQINRGRWVPQHVHAEWNLDLAAQFADNTRHARCRNRFDLGEVRQAGFVGEHHTVHTAILQGA